MFHDDRMPTGPLMTLGWATELLETAGMEPVMTADALLAPDSTMSSDHLFTTLLKVGMLDDLVCLYHRPSQVVHSLVALGPDICGHGGIVHGGMSATVMDETLGALAYSLKREGILGEGPAFTAHLHVDYKKPLPAPTKLICTAKAESIEGRKLWATAQIQDRPGGTVYVTGKALFLTSKPPPVPPL